MSQLIELITRGAPSLKHDYTVDSFAFETVAILCALCQIQFIPVSDLFPLVTASQESASISPLTLSHKHRRCRISDYYIILVAITLRRYVFFLGINFESTYEFCETTTAVILKLLANFNFLLPEAYKMPCSLVTILTDRRQSPTYLFYNRGMACCFHAL